MTSDTRITTAGWISTTAGFVMVGLGLYFALHGLAWLHTLREGGFGRTLVISDLNQLIAGAAIVGLGAAAIVSSRLLVRASVLSTAKAPPTVASDSSVMGPTR